MLGRTHAVMGVAAALMILQPKEPEMIVAGGVAAMAGALFPDTDSGNSLAQQGIQKVMGYIISPTVITGMVMYGANKYGIEFSLGELGQLLSGEEAKTAIIGIGGLLLAGIFGMRQKHRGIMHSLLMCAFTTILCCVASLKLAPFFAVGYLSHLFLDCMNYQGIQLLYPLDKKYSMKLCKSNGAVNAAMFFIGILAVVFTAYLLITTPMPLGGVK